MAGTGPLLVVIDMQRVFSEPQSPWAVPNLGALVPPIRRLVDAFAERVVFTRFVPFDDPPGPGSWADYYEQFPFFLLPEAEDLTRLMEPFDAREAPTLAAPTFSKYGPRLEALAGPERTIVLCGVSTDCCVISTALPALDAGMHVRVVRDACVGVTPASHDAAIAVMAGYAGHLDITTVEEELARP